MLVADQAGDNGLGDGGDDPVEDGHEGAVLAVWKIPYFFLILKAPLTDCL